MIHVKNILTLLGFSFRKHCSLVYFCCFPLDCIHYQLIVRNATICSGGLSTLVGIYSFCKKTVTYFILHVTVHPASNSAIMEMLYV